MFDTSKYYGDNKPSWQPNIDRISKGKSVRLSDGVFVIDDVFDVETCADLINAFNEQEMYPVGVDGFVDPDSEPGSFRAMAWSPEMANRMSEAFQVLPERYIQRNHNLVSEDDTTVIQTPFEIKNEIYILLGPTPFMRFMRYNSGGKHNPHHDASYICDEESYKTLYSWVMYLNDIPEEDGGSLDFVVENRHPANHPREDWHSMADENQVYNSIQPKRGRLVIFPHWLCHQVQEYTGNFERYIIRGDFSYADIGRDVTNLSDEDFIEAMVSLPAIPF